MKRSINSIYVRQGTLLHLSSHLLFDLSYKVQVGRHHIITLPEIYGTTNLDFQQHRTQRS